jgi:hypothetical protein
MPMASLVMVAALTLVAEAMGGYTASSRAKAQGGGKVTTDTATLDRIAAVDPVHADTMRRQPTTFSSQALPFYKTFKLVKASIRLPHRPLEFRYADDGAQAIHLSGSADDVYRVNDAEHLQLAESAVPDYVRFFVANADSSSRRLVESPGDLVWLPATESEAGPKAARAAASSKIHALQVSKSGAGYKVSAVALEGKRLVELALSVAVNGRVTVDSTKTVAEDVPVAATL